MIDFSHRLRLDSMPNTRGELEFHSTLSFSFFHSPLFRYSSVTKILIFDVQHRADAGIVSHFWEFMAVEDGPHNKYV